MHSAGVHEGRQAAGRRDTHLCRCAGRDRRSGYGSESVAIARRPGACRAFVGPAEHAVQRGHGADGQGWIKHAPADQFLEQHSSAYRLDRNDPAFRAKTGEQVEAVGHERAVGFEADAGDGVPRHDGFPWWPAGWGH
jgi:hypothetical protein